MGHALRIPGVAFGAVPPAPIVDSNLFTTGSLLCVEPGHPTNPWANGVPAHGDSVPNLCASQAQATVGSAVATMTFQNTIAAGEGIVERSAKKGLHVAESWTGGVSNHRVLLLALASLRSYLDANTGHKLYLSTWGRFTRMPDPSLTTAINHAAIVGATGTRLGVGMVPSGPTLSGTPSSSDARRLGFTVDSTAPGAFQAIAADGVPASGFTTPHGSTVFGVGPAGSSQVHKSAGYLLWRLYVEDLTVSGRTYAQVKDIDAAYYAQEVLATTGRYYNDTYTAPS